MTDFGEFNKNEVSYIKPIKYDKVCIMDGENLGKKGVLVALNNNLGVVRLSDGIVLNVDKEKITKVE